MTSAIGERRRQGGFTLLEMLIVLTIIVLFSGYFMLRFDDSREEELLSRASVDLKGAALQAKKRSYTFRQDYFIRFSKSAFELADRPAREFRGFGPIGEEEGDVIERYRLPAGVVMELWPPGAEGWIQLNSYTWTFRDSGLSEPLQVRFKVEDSSTTLNFNVLTGLAEEQTYIQ